MLGPHGDQVLRLLGREPAAQGIFEVAAMPALLQAIEAALVAENASRAATGSVRVADDEEGPAAVALRQRVWPLHELLRRAYAAGEVVVWGV